MQAAFAQEGITLFLGSSNYDQAQPLHMFTGFDDVAMAAQIDPPLTSMRVQNTAIGRLAAAYLLTRLAGGVPSPVPALVPDFVERCSTAPPG